MCDNPKKCRKPGGHPCLSCLNAIISGEEPDDTPTGNTARELVLNSAQGLGLVENLGWGGCGPLQSIDQLPVNNEFSRPLMAVDDMTEADHACVVRNTAGPLTAIDDLAGLPMMPCINARDASFDESPTSPQSLPGVLDQQYGNAPFTLKGRDTAQYDPQMRALLGLPPMETDVSEDIERVRRLGLLPSNVLDRLDGEADPVKQRKLLDMALKFAESTDVPQTMFDGGDDLPMPDAMNQVIYHNRRQHVANQIRRAQLAGPQPLRKPTVNNLGNDLDLVSPGCIFPTR